MYNFTKKMSNEKTLKIFPLLLFFSIISNTAFAGKKEEIREATKLIRRHPLNPEGYFLRGKIYHKYKNFKSAVKDYSMAIKLYTKHHQSYLNRGRIYLEQKEYEKAKEDFDKVIQLKRNWAEGYYWRGMYFETLKKYQQAYNDFTKATKLNKRHYKSFDRRGLIYLSIKKYKEAREDFSRSIKIKKNNKWSYRNLGYLFETTHDLKKALSCYERALKIDKDFYYALSGKARVLQKMGKLEEALKFFELAIKNADDAGKKVFNQLKKKRILSILPDLKKLEKKDSIPYLLKRINSKDEGIRKAAYFLIGQLGSWRELKFIFGKLKNQPNDLRSFKEEAIFNLSKKLSFLNKKTYSYSSKNYKIVSNTTKEFTEMFSKRLEEYRRFILNFFNIEEFSRTGVYKIYIFKHREEFRAHARKRVPQFQNFKGYSYPPKSEIVTYMSNTYIGLLQILQHEIIHPILYILGNDPPLWFDEGFAVYFETVRFVNGRFKRGDINRVNFERIVKALKEKQKINLRKIIFWQKEAFSKKGIPLKLNYAISWSLIHFFIHYKKGKYFSNLKKYLNMLSEKVEVKKAFKECFGFKFDNLKKEWREYIESLNK